MGPLFAKSGMRFECEMVDTVTCQTNVLKEMQQINAKSSGFLCTFLWIHTLHPGTSSLATTKIRDWCRMMPTGASLRNAYRARKGDRDKQGDADAYKVPQSFSFMPREGRTVPNKIVSQRWPRFENYITFPSKPSCRSGQACRARDTISSWRTTCHADCDHVETGGTSLPWWRWLWVMMLYHNLHFWSTPTCCWATQKVFSTE